MKTPSILKISNEQYHAMEGISKSGWFLFNQSPLDYKWSKDHPEPPKRIMDVGTIAHSMILEQKFLEDIAVLQPEDIKVRRGKKWDDFSIKHQDKIILTQKDWNNVEGIAYAVTSHPRFEELLTGGIAEQSFFWSNDQYGFLQKCRPDYLPGNGIVTSFKTTGNANPWPFGKVAGDKKYFWSACLELAGVSICTGARHNEYWYVIVQQEPPHHCWVGDHFPADIDAGQQQLEILYQKYAECLETDIWPSYEDQTIHMPPYATIVDWDKVEDPFLNSKGGIYD